MSKELEDDKFGESEDSGLVGDMVGDGLEGVGEKDGASVQVDIVEAGAKEGEERHEEELSVSKVTQGDK